MANVIELNGYAVPAQEAGVFTRLRAAFAEHREYRALLGELNALSDRDLADIGVSRHQIDEIARQGARAR